MASQIAVLFGFAAVLLMLGAVLGSVERRERFVFVLGVALVLVGLTFLTAPRILSVTLVLGGIGAVIASAIPLLR